MVYVYSGILAGWPHIIMVPAGKYRRDTGYRPAFKKRMRIMSKDREDE